MKLVKCPHCKQISLYQMDEADICQDEDCGYVQEYK